MQDDETQAVELPNGPARVVTDTRKDRFKLEYGGDAIFQATVKVARDDGELSFRDAGARLFVVSKFDGWDVVTQTIRVAAVGARPGDRIFLRGHACHSGEGVAPEMSADSNGVYSPDQDWLLTIDDGPDASFAPEEIAVKGDPQATVARIAVTATGVEVGLRFLPYYRQRHCAA